MNKTDTKSESILKEPAGVPLARKEIETAIEKIKPKVRIDAGQLENKKELGGISAHNDKTKIYTANFKGKPEVIVCKYTFHFNMLIYQVKETAISPYKWSTLDLIPELAEDIRRSILEIEKELETVT